MPATMAVRLSAPDLSISTLSGNPGQASALARSNIGRLLFAHLGEELRDAWLREAAIGGEELVCWHVDDELALFEEDDAVGDAPRELDLVRDKHHRRAGFGEFG